MNLSELRPADGSKQEITLEKVVDMVQVMVKQQVRVIKDKKLVPELQELGLKVDRCHYTEEFLNVVLLIEIQKKSLQLM